MAERRMVSSTITECDEFFELSSSAQLLYFHLCICADDDGFANCSKRIQMQIGCNADDFNQLVAGGYLIAFERGIVVITHWNLHNTIRRDRRKPSRYQKELSMLTLLDDKTYALADTEQMSVNCPPSGNQMTADCPPNGNQMTANCPPNGNQMTANCPPSGNQMTANCPLNGNQMTANCPSSGNQMSAQYSIDKVSVDEVRQGKARQGEGNAAAARAAYGEHKKILLSDEEYSSLTDDYGINTVAEYIARMDDYLSRNPGKSYDNYCSQLKYWLKKDNVRTVVNYKRDNYFDPKNPWGD